MKDDWDKEFEQFEVNTTNRKIYKELFSKWYFKLFWRETKEEVKNELKSD